jgi:uncharacterized UBP type Zn finger protein
VPEAFFRLRVASLSQERTALSSQSRSDPSLGAGLANQTGEYNCFLNVVLQALFNCERFRGRLLLESSDHRCNGSKPEECVTCSMVSVFTQMSSGGSGAADPSVLRRALGAAFEVRLPGLDRDR